MQSGRIIVHRGRAHVDDFLAGCVCVYKTGLQLFRMNVDEGMLNDPSCWVLDQGLRFEPDLHNFDHHHLNDQICSLTMLLDHLYPGPYREFIPQLEYIEIHDSVGSSRAGRFAGLPYEGLEVASSLVQQLLLKGFSKIEGLVSDPFRSIMSSMGGELCGRIEEIPRMMGELDAKAKIVESCGLKVLDVTGCDVSEPDRLPTKSWCERMGVSPAVILTKDSRRPGLYRMVGVDRSVRFVPGKNCEYTHPSGFLTVFSDLDDWESILRSAFM